MFILVLQAIIYYLQAREDQFDKLRPAVIIINLVSLVWFYFIQYYRFKDTGRACSGDFKIWADTEKAKETTI